MPSGQSQTQEKISLIGIPTANRPRLLQRALESYGENVQKHGRVASFIVVDDSSSNRVARATLAAAKRASVSHDLSIRYLNRQYRRALADKLAARIRIDPEIVRFALVGDNRCNTTCGAARNTLQLLSTGKLSLQVDDDTLCRIASAPEPPGGIVLSSLVDPNEYWFFRSHQSAVRFCSFGDYDILGIHERLLGRSRAAVMEKGAVSMGPVALDDLSPRFQDDIRSDSSRIVITFAGSVGDSGMRNHVPWLFLKGASFRRLTAEESSYRTFLHTRQIMRMPACAVISNGAFSMMLNAGFDHRTLLPPFMPVGRRQDGVFSAVMQVLFERSLKGFLPFAVLHAPPIRQPEYAQTDESLLQPRVNDLMMLLILSCGQTLGGEHAGEKLGKLGLFLTSLGRLPLREFRQLLFDMRKRMFSNQVVAIEKRLCEEPQGLRLWKDDMLHLSDACKQIATSELCYVPSDLRGSSSERVELLQELISKYGKVLRHWEEIWEAARSGLGSPAKTRRREGMLESL